MQIERSSTNGQRPVARPAGPGSSSAIARSGPIGSGSSARWTGSPPTSGPAGSSGPARRRRSASRRPTGSGRRRMPSASRKSGVGPSTMSPSYTSHPVRSGGMRLSRGTAGPSYGRSRWLDACRRGVCRRNRRRLRAIAVRTERAAAEGRGAERRSSRGTREASGTECIRRRVRGTSRPRASARLRALRVRRQPRSPRPRAPARSRYV